MKLTKKKCYGQNWNSKSNIIDKIFFIKFFYKIMPNNTTVFEFVFFYKINLRDKINTF